MFSVDEFIAKYRKYSDEELLQIHLDIENYSREAKEAFAVVIADRGGIEPLLKKQARKQVLAFEVQRIQKEAAGFSEAGSDISFAKKMISSDILDEKEVNDILADAFLIAEKKKEDIKITPRTITGSIIGGIIASQIIY